MNDFKLMAYMLLLVYLVKRAFNDGIHQEMEEDHE